MSGKPATRGQEYIFWVSLVSQSNPATFQNNPTLAAGDVKVSKDGGALTNLGTLPAVTPASSKLVKVTLSATEMDADNVTVIFSDAAGDQWADLTVDVKTVGYITHGVISDVAPIVTDFDTDLTEADDFWNGSFIVFTDGALQGQARKINDYANTNGNITVTAFTAAPANGDPFVIIGRSE